MLAQTRPTRPTQSLSTSGVAGDRVPLVQLLHLSRTASVAIYLLALFCVQILNFTLLTQSLDDVIPHCNPCRKLC